MKTIKNLGFVFLASAMIMPLFAFHSTITDTDAGNATDVVETGNVIHVYNFTGVSSEAGLVSTFNEGEDWKTFVWTPKKTTVSTKLNVRTTSSGLINSSFKTPYVQAIDNCLAMGSKWDHRTDTCN